VASRVKLPRTGLLYGGLLACLALAWVIPESYLLSLPALLRFIAATVLAFAPIFIANLIFAERFRNTQDSTEAFGVNLIGAIFGSLLEYTSLIIGYHGLLLIAATLYTLAILVMSTKSLRVVSWSN
jgi:hypothetical protein